MKEIIHNNYLLTREECMVLLAAMGETQLTLLQSQQTNRLSDKELQETLFHLFRKDILVWKDENSYELKEEIRELFQGIRNAATEVIIFSKVTNSVLFCYCGEQISVIEQMYTENQPLHMHVHSPDEWWEEIADRGFMTQNDMKQVQEFFQREKESEKRKATVIIGAEELENVIDEFRKGKRFCLELFETWYRKHPEIRFCMVIREKDLQRDDRIICCSEPLRSGKGEENL